MAAPTMPLTIVTRLEVEALATSVNSLVWMPELGAGFYPVDTNTSPYNAEYFEKYKGYDDTPMGRAITRARQVLVDEVCGPDTEVLDVGIGSGQFVRLRPHTFGYDVNPVGRSWLESSGFWADLFERQYDAVTFWDSLEHIKDIGSAVDQARRYLFVSMPIYEDCAHVLRSKHYRPDEHFWYFTRDGLVMFMDRQGFDLVRESWVEVALGREDIGSFAFARR